MRMLSLCECCHHDIQYNLALYFLLIILLEVFHVSLLYIASCYFLFNFLLFSYAFANFSKWFLLLLSDTSVRNFLLSRKIKFQRNNLPLGHYHPLFLPDSPTFEQSNAFD